MHAGRSPFKAATDYLIFQRIKNRDLTFPDGFPEVAQDIVEKLLALEPSERLGSEATGGIDALKQHPYFEGVDWENIWESQAPPLKERLDAKLKKIQEQNSETVDNNNEFDTWLGGDEEQQQQHQQQQQIEHIQKEQQHRQEQSRGIIVPGVPTVEGGRQEASSSSSPAPVVPGVLIAHSIPPSPTTPTDPFGDHAATKNQVYEDDDSDDDGIPRYNNKYGSTSVRGPAAVAVRRYPSVATSARSDDIASTSSAGLAIGRRGHTRNSSSYSSTNAQSLERLGEQSHPPWIAHLYPNESIIRASRVSRKRGLFSKKRFLMLTDRPRLLYLDEGPAQDGSGGALRCEIDWNAELLPELKTKSVFCIHTVSNHQIYREIEE